MTTTPPPKPADPNAMAKRLASLQLGSMRFLFTADHSAGMCLIHHSNTHRLGLLRWDSPEAHADPELEKQIVWGRAGQLLPLAQDAEAAFNLTQAPPDMLISAQINGYLRTVN